MCVSVASAVDVWLWRVCVCVRLRYFFARIYLRKCTWVEKHKKESRIRFDCIAAAAAATAAAVHETNVKVTYDSTKHKNHFRILSWFYV